MASRQTADSRSTGEPAMCARASIAIGSTASLVSDSDLNSDTPPLQQLQIRLHPVHQVENIRSTRTSSLSSASPLHVALLTTTHTLPFAHKSSGHVDRKVKALDVRKGAGRGMAAIAARPANCGRSRRHSEGLGLPRPVILCNEALRTASDHHLRVCGEHSLHFASCSDADESSPPVRGTLG